ncbi:hypothetical protein BK022_13915 [Methylorubrum extorquens]|uniref:Uncharacterized protein n=1 Tax=Methylorubrum extorquens TaxID=408 RepID=A0A1S1NZN0_METEX|nr:hypothetical protein BK022_13915 [Methylorubrum extorquens]
MKRRIRRRQRDAVDDRPRRRPHTGPGHHRERLAASEVARLAGLRCAGLDQGAGQFGIVVDEPVWEQLLDFGR